MASGSEKVSRERKALVFFIFLVVLGLGALGFYIYSVGHSFNVMASNLDDATGNMEEYTAILYEGTLDEKLSIDEAITKTIPGNDSVAKDLNAKAKEQGGTEHKKNAKEQKDQVTASDALDFILGSREDKEELSLDALKRSYEEKNASVLVLNVTNPNAYDTDEVVQAGKYTFGIVGVYEQIDQDDLSPRLNFYESQNVDFVVGVTSNLALVEELEGFDIVVSTQDEALFPLGITVDGTFYDDAVLHSEVGTILISPSRVISGKDVSRL